MRELLAPVVPQMQGSTLTWAYMLVFVGGGAGSVARYAISRAAAALVGHPSPFATLVANVLGCALAGALVSLFAHRSGGTTIEQAKLLLLTGFLGGFTTFSAFAMEAAVFWQRGEAGAAVVYIAASVVLSFAGLFAAGAVVHVLLR